MPRHFEGRHHTIKQKGYARNGLGTYSRMKKSRKAERYDRPYLEGTYKVNLDPLFHVKQ